MRILSITKHLREQNWVAVFLDFFIVVVGVYMGLQVQEWSSKRAQNDEAAAYHARLAIEYEALVDTLKGHSEFYDGFLRNGINLTSMLLAEQVIDQDDATQLMKNSLFSLTPPKNPAVLDEMISAGKMSLIADPVQRTQLLNTRYQLQLIESFYEFLNLGIEEIIPLIQGCTVINGVQPVADNAPIPEDLISIRFDFTCLQSEPEMPVLMTEWLQRLEGMHSVYIQTIEEFETVTKQLQDLARENR